MKNNLAVWMLSLVLAVFIARGFFIVHEIRDILLQLSGDISTYTYTEKIYHEVDSLKDFFVICSGLLFAIIIPPIFLTKKNSDKPDLV